MLGSARLGQVQETRSEERHCMLLLVFFVSRISSPLHSSPPLSRSQEIENGIALGVAVRETRQTSHSHSQEEDRIRRSLMSSQCHCDGGPLSPPHRKLKTGLAVSIMLKGMFSPTIYLAEGRKKIDPDGTENIVQLQSKKKRCVLPTFNFFL